MRTSKKARDAGFRSGLEQKIALQLTSRGANYVYESKQSKVEYVVPERHTTYLPDFVLGNGVIIEAKGLFTAKDRQKHLLIQKQKPHLDIRFIFGDSKKRLSKKSRTSYACWCVKNNFQYADNKVPQLWIDERKDLIPW